jgi:hypothetical protein
MPKPANIPGLFIPEQKPKLRGLGDIIEAAAKPIAVALKLKCLDEHHKLRPESECAKRKARLNNVTINF